MISDNSLVMNSDMLTEINLKILKLDEVKQEHESLLSFKFTNMTDAMKNIVRGWMNKPDSIFHNSSSVLIVNGGDLNEFSFRINMRYTVRNLRYPFDCQNFAIQFDDCVADLDNVDLNVVLSNALNNNWIVESSDILHNTNSSIRIFVRRIYKYHLRNLFFPIFCIFLSSFSVLLFDCEELSARMSILLTNLLSIIAFSIFYNSLVPKHPEFNIFDSFLFVNLSTLVALIIIVNTTFKFNNNYVDNTLGFFIFGLWFIYIVYLIFKVFIINRMSAKDLVLSEDSGISYHFNQKLLVVNDRF